MECLTFQQFRFFRMIIQSCFCDSIIKHLSKHSAFSVKLHITALYQVPYKTVCVVRAPSSTQGTVAFNDYLNKFRIYTWWPEVEPYLIHRITYWSVNVINFSSTLLTTLNNSPSLSLLVPPLIANCYIQNKMQICEFPTLYSYQNHDNSDILSLKEIFKITVSINISFSLLRDILLSSMV